MNDAPPEKRIELFEGFVLAGGRSSRMGATKALLRFENKTFLERASQILSPTCGSRIKIVLNQNQSAKDFSAFSFVRDFFQDRGALGGIHAALAASTSEWTIILACDLPLITIETIKELSELALNLPNDIASVVPREADGKIQPLCAIYRSDLCLSPLKEILQSQNSASIRDFLKSLPTFYVESKKTPGFNNSVFFNVNTPADYDVLSNK